MKSSQTMKPTHMLLCVVLLVAGVVLFATEAGGLVFLPLLLCGLMMGVMMWMMMRSGRDGRGDR